ncbi:hypothetical protein CBR_g16980 [Chara braunii]|uniref:Phosphatidylinositol-specific phospholipase C X domain-containing protein n=1 Tax=Chara braunii TaxID=69332 RepID=A0A388KUA4_CHABU|nr:hypothetical protein CBR_g16980 [Chara braunii]|eukprot:GBG73637.1 hypothetical protein CBR_g16980 [Chara braunii]
MAGKDSKGGVFGLDYSRRYDQNCYLCAHNAYAARSYGWCYYQQTSGVFKQLQAGVRALMLDVWIKGEEVFLCHEGFKKTQIMKPFSQPTKLSSLFLEVRQFLDSNPREVVTCFFESYVNNRDVMHRAFKEGNVEDIIFWQDSEENDVCSKGWPTLQDMVDKNKRLVLFSDNRDDGIPYEWRYCTQNVYGSAGTSSTTWMDARSKNYPLTCPNTLFVLNHFPSVAVNVFEMLTRVMAKINSKDKIINHARACREACKAANAQCDRIPNFVAIDLIDRGKTGGGPAAVEEINRWWAEATGGDKVEQQSVNTEPAVVTEGGADTSEAPAVAQS